jgi:hypothetical protein
MDRDSSLRKPRLMSAPGRDPELLYSGVRILGGKCATEFQVFSPGSVLADRCSMPGFYREVLRDA